MSWLKRVFTKKSPREAILARGTRKRELYDGLGVPVYVKAPSALILLQYNDRVRNSSPDGKNVPDDAALRMIAELVTKVCVDEHWNPVFEDSDVDTLISRFSFDELNEVVMVSMKLQGVTQEQLEQARADLKKAQGSASPTS